MANQYDVIVIGAGNAGLTAAAYTAKAGLKTLLLEKHNLPGGCATSFKRGRFEFEASLHELCEFGPADNPGTVRKIFDEIGLDVEMVPVEDCFHLKQFPVGFSKSIPTGRENFIAAMAELVPGCEESMRKFFALADDAGRAVAYLSSCGTPDPEVLKRDHPNFLKFGYRSVDDVLNAIGMPEKAQTILTTYWTYICIPTNEFEFVLYANMLAEYVDRQAYIPKLRSHGISTAFDAKIREYGGDIWYNTAVDEILVKDGKACGVRIGDRVVAAKKIITCLNPHTVYANMMQPEAVPERALKLANARELGISAVTVYYGLNKSAEELGIHDYSRFVKMPGKSQDTFERFKTLNTKMIGGTMNCLNVPIPDYSPEGTCIVWATTLYRPGAWDHVTPEEYNALKDTIAIKMAKFFKMTGGIDLLAHLEEYEVATPVTFARYLNTPTGAIYGYQGRKWDNMMQALTISLPHRMPIPLSIIFWPPRALKPMVMRILSILTHRRPKIPKAMLWTAPAAMPLPTALRMPNWPM